MVIGTLIHIAKFIQDGDPWDGSLDPCFCFIFYESPEERTEDYFSIQCDISVPVWLYWRTPGDHPQTCAEMLSSALE